MVFNLSLNSLSHENWVISEETRSEKHYNVSVFCELIQECKILSVKTVQTDFGQLHKVGYGRLWELGRIKMACVY